MTPSARVEAAIEVLDAVINAATREGAAADTMLQRYFAQRRYAGSKDRRAVRELVFAVIRGIGERPVSGRAAMIGYARAHDPALLHLFDGSAHGPAVLTDEPAAEPGFAPAWIKERLARLPDAPAILASLSGRAPLDLRVNTLKSTPEAVAAVLPGLSPISLVANGLRTDTPFNVEATAAYRDGLVEVQDAGSQLIAELCAAGPGMNVVDLCAGAGGKSLALAAAMRNAGAIIACDTDRGRLSRLAPRAARAGVSIVATRLLDPGRELDALADLVGRADLVLVDAPCSGTGTWRRNPEAKWRLSAERLQRLTALQARLVDIAAGLLRPGGRLVYAVCSLLPEEGPMQADAIEARLRLRPWQSMPAPAEAGRLTLDPFHHGCDGFFIAGYEKP